MGGGIFLREWMYHVDEREGSSGKTSVHIKSQTFKIKMSGLAQAAEFVVNAGVTAGVLSLLTHSLQIFLLQNTKNKK